MLLSVTTGNEFRAGRWRAGSLFVRWRLLLFCWRPQRSTAYAPGAGQQFGPETRGAPRCRWRSHSTRRSAWRRRASLPMRAASGRQPDPQAWTAPSRAPACCPMRAYYNQDIYTQPNGLYAQGGAGESHPDLPKFVANDSRPREYIAQGIVNENLSLAGWRPCAMPTRQRPWPAPSRRSRGAGWWRQSPAMFYSSAGGGPQAGGCRAGAPGGGRLYPAHHQREQAREAAHADVVKAQLVEQQRDRDVGGRAVGRREGTAGAGRAVVCRSAHALHVERAGGGTAACLEGRRGAGSGAKTIRN